MALVAYDNSDSSDYEDEDESPPVVLLNTKTESKLESRVETPVSSNQGDGSPTENGRSLFNLLPQPTNTKSLVVEEDDEFLHKKAVSSAVKPKAKISVPSLSDFKDVESSIPSSKPKVASEKKSGLLNLLPQPRNTVTATTKSLIPHVLTKKPAPKTGPTPAKKSKLNSTLLINDYSDDSGDDEIQNDFFSMNKPVDIIPDVSMEIEESSAKTVPEKPLRRGIEAFFKQEEIVNEVAIEPEDSNRIDFEASSSHNGLASENSNSNELELDEEAIMKLVGARSKRKREEIQIVDVNQEEVLGNAREMLMKGLMDDTTKRVSASKKKGHEPTSQQRRKHQITYLAFQAKANEAELQNQWSNNRMSKRQTQAKYGF